MPKETKPNRMATRSNVILHEKTPISDRTMPSMEQRMKRNQLGFDVKKSKRIEWDSELAGSIGT